MIPLKKLSNCPPIPLPTKNTAEYGGYSVRMLK